MAERNLAAAAFGHLTEAFTDLPFEALGPTKTLLKRFFSSAPWGPEDDAALATTVGAGEGWWERPLDGELTLVFGWDARGFGVEVRGGTAHPGPEAPATADASADPLAGGFDGPVLPEATPSPRTIRFAVGRPLTGGDSHWFPSRTSATDTRAARLFRQFEEVAGVLVGPDFVAVMLARPADWERLLRPVLAVVTEEFSDPGDERATGRTVAAGGPAGAGVVGGQAGDGKRLNRLERAWRELGSLRPAEPADLAVVVAAASDEADHYRRQVAANLLREADPAVAAAEWSRLIADPVGAVRRATVDAVVDAGREELRPLLESALADTNAWVRWKALRGLVELGPADSREAIEARADDPDFRVRLEAAGALRGLGDKTDGGRPPLS